LEALIRLALREGQKENNEGDEKMASEISIKTIGRILAVLALPILIINAVLLNMKDVDVKTTGILLFISVCLLIPGLILSYLPHEKDKEEKER
jgi:predicted permease